MKPKPLTGDIVVLLEGCFVRYNAVKSAVEQVLAEIKKEIEKAEEEVRTYEKANDELMANYWRGRKFEAMEMYDLLKKAFEGVIEE